MDDSAYIKITELINTSNDDEALALCDELLKNNPNDARALCRKGDICLLNEMYGDAYNHYKDAYDIDIECYDAVKGMANSLAVCGKYYRAVKVFEKALDLKRDDALLWEQYGECLMLVKYYKMADKAFSQAVILNPEIKEKMYIRRADAMAHFADAEEMTSFYKEALSLFPKTQYLLFSYASFLFEVNRDYEQAFSFFVDAIEANRENKTPSVALSNILYRVSIRNKEEGAKLARRWFAYDKNDPMAKHTYYALCGSDEEKVYSATDYVEELFDYFADTFDDVLPTLSYMLPHRFATLTEQYALSSEKRIDILDAGCGTGLCGENILSYKNSGYISTLTGVDLSQGMLAKADEKNVYDYLLKDGISDFMENNPSAFDLIMSADVFIYNGDLNPIISAAWKALREDGIYLFSISLGEADKYVIDGSGRFFHNPVYVKEVLQKNKFNIEYIEKCVVRMEFGKPEYGMIFVARKPKTLRSYL